MNKTTKLYHCSHVPNLTVLKPRVSTHGKSYVYATPYLALSLLFGSKKSYGDFDGMYGINKEGKPNFYEAYEGALERRFKGESAYIYEVDPTDFEENKTSFSAEVVSEVPVKVIKCTKIEDLYTELLKLIQQGEIEFKAYNINDEKYVRFIDEHIEHRFRLFEIYKTPKRKTYEHCCYNFPHIVKKVEQEVVPERHNPIIEKLERIVYEKLTTNDLYKDTNNPTFKFFNHCFPEIVEQVKNELHLN